MNQDAPSNIAPPNVKPSPDAFPRCGEPSRDYGEFVTSRGTQGSGFYLQVFFILVLSLFGIGLITVGFFPPASTKSTTPPDPVPMFIVGTILFAGAVYQALKLLYSYDFYEQGLIRKGPRRTDEFAYDKVERVSYNLVRQYHNGVYTGTQLNLKLWMEDGRKFSFGGRHKERRKGFIKRHFEGEDEMDIVREAIEIHVAERIETQLQNSGEFDWCNAASVSRAGVTARTGKRKASLVPWPDLTEVLMKNGHLHLFARGDKKSFLSIPSAGVNFFPCLRVFCRLAEEARGQSVPTRESENQVKTRGVWSA
ncbi:MAG: hypothetical protein U0573_08350 [Phycisphaerales bacterium]|nr:hypothetical protein [Planctomycetota bacterium]